MPQHTTAFIAQARHAFVQTCTTHYKNTINNTIKNIIPTLSPKKLHLHATNLFHHLMF